MFGPLREESYPVVKSMEMKMEMRNMSKRQQPEQRL